ncbi:MAG: hypothetical protein HY923_05445 [Elusimicrobia bacterium]|nr:hypothetical protein [Elusimicrobiota bacterium]
MVLLLLSSTFASAKPQAVSPASAKDSKKPAKQAARTWKTVIDYVMKNGADDAIIASAARTIGYGSDAVDSKALCIEDDKSKDGWEHDIDIVYEKDDKGIIKPKELVIGTIKVKTSGENQEIESYRIRVSLDGSPIRGMRATGLVGHVVQTPLPGDSPELLRIFKKESSLYLREIELTSLTK